MTNLKSDQKPEANMELDEPALDQVVGGTVIGLGHPISTPSGGTTIKGTTVESPPSDTTVSGVNRPGGSGTLFPGTKQRGLIDRGALIGRDFTFRKASAKWLALSASRPAGC